MMLSTLGSKRRLLRKWVSWMEKLMLGHPTRVKINVSETTAVASFLKIQDHKEIDIDKSFRKHCKRTTECSSDRLENAQKLLIAPRLQS